LNKIIFWSIFVFVITGFLVLIGNVLAPFVISCIIAYILQPLISTICSKYNISRTIIAFVVFIIFISIFLFLLIGLLPSIYQQIASLINKIPTYKNYIQTEIVPMIVTKVTLIDPTIGAKIKDSLQSLISSIFSIITLLTNNIWFYTVATINKVAMILLIPIILFYFLRDWPKMIDNLESLLPLQEKSKVREILFSINKLLSAYIRGQLNICLLLACFYGLGLSIIGTELSLLIGILSGILIIIPFIGTLISFSLAIIIGYFSFGWQIELSYIILLYVIGNIIESYILTPKIIGDKIGLHPLWIMFSVFASGALFGFIGIFFAIPIAGIIKVLLNVGIEQYKSSKIYTA
jgi:putative permease